MPVPYFENFPYTAYSLKDTDSPDQFNLVTDIFRRVAPVANLLKNKKMFYPYLVIEGETPEMLAHRVYGSTKYHWVVNLINNITDPLLDWPKDYSNLVAHIIDTYGSVAAAASGIHHHTMTISKVDSLGNSSSETFIIDLTKYNTLVSLVPVVTTFAGGATVTTTITRATVDNYTHEVDANEAKRSIVLLKETFLPQVVAQLESTLT